MPCTGAAMAHRPRWGDAECISNGDVEAALTPQVTRLLQADPAHVRGLDRMFLDKLLAEIPALAEVQSLAYGFAALVRKEGTGTLDGWLAGAAGTPLRSFAEGLGKDHAAVRAALKTS